MNPRYLLDTSLIIYIRRQRPAVVLKRFGDLFPGEATMSAITFGELAHGVARSADREGNMKVLRELSGFIPVAPLPPAAGEIYGVLQASLKRKGEIIGNNDLWIAAHAHAAGLILVTNNEREFRRIPELRIENWAAGPA